MRPALALVTLMIALAGAPANACSPSRPLPTPSNEQARRDTLAVIAKSDAIIDARVAWDRHRRPYLRPLRVWKGPRRRSYLIANDGCGVFLPVAGEKVRVILYDAAGSWLVQVQLLDGDYSARTFDRTLDRYLNSPHPRAFRSIGPAGMPIPLRR